MYSTATLIYLTTATLVLLLLTKVVQNAFISPLRKVPGPWWSSITGFPTKIAILFSRQVHCYHDLHRKYGPFVRIAPSEIIVSDLTSFKEIHRIGTQFVKSDFYKYLNPTEAGQGPYNVFAQVDPVAHSRRRRLLSRGFSLSFLRTNWEAAVREKVAFAVERIKGESAQNGEVDVLKWWMFMASDIISLLMFGESFDILKLGHKTEWFDAQEKGTIANAMAWHFPLLYRFLRLLPIRAIQHAFSSHKRLYTRGQLAVTNSRSASTAKNMFAAVLAEAEKDEVDITDTEIIIEAAAFNLAGTDTTANTLTYLVWAVLSDARLQKSLEDEVAALEDPIMDACVETLPILNAVVKETLRLYGAAPGALPRVTPAGGVQLGEYFIPGGTTVSTQAWTLHRDPALFPDPDRFDYTRWLSSAALSDDAKAAFSPFGAGSRICIGIHLAYMELRLAAATFFRNCKGARLSPSTTPKSMEVENIFLIGPKAGECKVVIPQ